MAGGLRLTGFRKRADGVSLALAGGHIAVVLLPVYLAALSGPHLAAVFLWLWFGLLMHGLINLMHECAHYHAFTSRGMCDVFGRWILGPLLFTDFEPYRLRHFAHHRHLGVAGDTKDVYLRDIRSWRILRLAARCFGGIEALQKARLQVPGAAAPRARSDRAWLVRTLAVQLPFMLSLLLTASLVPGRSGSAVIAAAAVAYIGVYGYGLASLTTLVATLRGICEHQIGGGPVKTVGRAALRNLSCNPVSRLVFGAYGFAEHATHHIHPAIPAYHLKTVTASLVASDPAIAPRHGYVETLIALVRAPAGAPATVPPRP